MNFIVQLTLMAFLIASPFISYGETSFTEVECVRAEIQTHLIVEKLASYIDGLEAGETGGMGKIYFGKMSVPDPSLEGSVFQAGQKVAVKIPRGPKYIPPLKWEFEVLRDIKDPVGYFPKVAYRKDLDIMVIERIEGITLKSFLGNPETRKYLNNQDVAISIKSQLQDILDTLRGNELVHGDMKPGNIMIQLQKSTPIGKPTVRVRLLDFGLAAPIGGYPKPGVETRTRGGTRQWSSPSQIKNNPAEYSDDRMVVQEIDKIIDQAKINETSPFEIFIDPRVFENPHLRGLGDY